MKIEDILNMQIKPHIHQWRGREDGMTCGSLKIILPNGTKIIISSIVHECGMTSSDISIYDLKDTNLTIIGKVRKSLKRFAGFIITKIKAVA